MLNWKAEYADGSVLTQYNADGTENKYSEISKSNLSKFIIMEGEQPKLVVHVEGKKLIYKQRAIISNTGRRERIWIAGWQENKDGSNVQCVSFLFPDGHVEVMPKFKEKAPFYTIDFNLLPRGEK